MANPPESRFQLHLSTALLAMFAAGALIWANTFKHVQGDLFMLGFPFTFYVSGMRPESGSRFDSAMVLVDATFAMGLLFEVIWIFESKVRKRPGSFVLLGAVTGLLFFVFAFVMLLLIFQDRPPLRLGVLA